MSAKAFQGAGGGVASSSPLMNNLPEPTIFELSSPGRSAASFRTTLVPEVDPTEAIDAKFLRPELLNLPEIAERDLVGHYTRLASRQYSVDLGAYPLGSCTMKYNPKFADRIASMPSWSDVHPNSPDGAIQGWMWLMAELERYMCEITGMSAATLQPAAGAAGELTGLLIMRAYHDYQNRRPTKVIIPDSAHGTNPASVTLGGYEVVTVPSDERGLVDLEVLRKIVDDDIAGMMLTNPNTLGLFEQDIAEIASVVHEVGGLMYYDGANLNAVLGVSRPGDMGFDIVHSNLHKTFATPHGGGGPGAGPVAVTKELGKFLPGPIPKVNPDPEGAGQYIWEYPSHSIGRVHGFYGNAVVLARALSYMYFYGGDGLRKVSDIAVLNANWLKNMIAPAFETPYSGTCMHEFVASAKSLKRNSGVRALDVAKALLDRGFHAPTVYFPLVVEEALMIEPTETESPQTLMALAEALLDISEAALSADRRQSVLDAPTFTPVKRLDEALAARKPILNFDTVID